MAAARAMLRAVPLLPVASVGQPPVTHQLLRHLGQIIRRRVDGLDRGEHRVQQDVVGAEPEQGVEPAPAFLPLQPDSAAAAGAAGIPPQQHVGGQAPLAGTDVGPDDARRNPAGGKSLVDGLHVGPVRQLLGSAGPPGRVRQHRSHLCERKRERVGSGGAAEDGGGADHAGAELVPDAVDRRFGHQPRFAGAVQADLRRDLVGADEVLALEGEGGQPSALQACGVHQRSARVRRFLMPFEAEPSL